MRTSNLSSRSPRSFLVVPEPTEADLDPYTIDETTLTLEDWRRRPPVDDSGVEIVRLHQHHGARLVA
jgi:hypothetical protein